MRAESKLAQVTQLVPPEPAGWANWGLLALRQRNFEPAAERLERARSLAPENDQILYLLGLLESSRGRSAEAVAALRKAIEINPKNLVATYKLAEEIERQGDENSEAEYQRLMQKVLEFNRIIWRRSWSWDASRPSAATLIRCAAQWPGLHSVRLAGLPKCNSS